MNITIPAAAVEATARAMHDAAYKIDAPDDPDQWDDMPDTYKDMVRAEARAACIALLEAWPDMAHRVLPYAALILPLPTEASDER
jgi:hypothetical protein